MRQQKTKRELAASRRKQNANLRRDARRMTPELLKAHGSNALDACGKRRDTPEPRPWEVPESPEARERYALTRFNEATAKARVLILCGDSAEKVRADALERAGREKGHQINMAEKIIAAVEALLLAEAAKGEAKP